MNIVLKVIQKNVQYKNNVKKYNILNDKIVIYIYALNNLVRCFNILCCHMDLYRLGLVIKWGIRWFI